MAYEQIQPVPAPLPPSVPIVKPVLDKIASTPAPASAARMSFDSKGKEDASSTYSFSGHSSAQTPSEGPSPLTSPRRAMLATAKKLSVRLPTRVDVHEGGGEGLTVHMVGFFWLSYQSKFQDVLKVNADALADRKNSANIIDASVMGESLTEPLQIAVDNPRSIACGHNNVSIIDADGGLWMYGPVELPVPCFGATTDSGLDDRLHIDIGRRLVKVEILFPIRQVACGSYFTLAETEGGQLYSWGLNSNLNTTGLKGNEVLSRIRRKEFLPGGQLGRSETLVEDPKPDVVMKTQNCIAFSCGTSHSFLICEQGICGWGCNEESQLGLAGNSATRVLLPSQMELKATKSLVRQVSCGSHHTAILCDNGRVYVWGWNKHGQLGRTSPPLTEFPMELQDIPLVRYIACGESHSLALTVDGSIWSWGSNRYGELGRPDGNYLPMALRLGPEFEHERWVRLGACGFSSSALAASGIALVWGFLKNQTFQWHQYTPRILSFPNVYISELSLGLSHVVFSSDTTLGQVLRVLSESNCCPPESQYGEIASLMAQSRGDVLHHVQNRALQNLSMESARVHCNVAYLVTNTQLLIVNFSQVLVKSLSRSPVNVALRIPNPGEIPSGCTVTISPKSFRLGPGEEVTVNVSVNVSKSVHENVTSLLEILVTQESKRRFIRRKASAIDSTKYFLVLAFPYTPMLNGRYGDTSSYLLDRFCAEGDVVAVKNILDRGDSESAEALIASQDYEGRTPLFVAAQAGQGNVVKMLVARGANVNMPDAQGLTPLSAASANGHSAVVEYLLSVGGSLDSRRLGASEGELAFLRAANKLYIGARKQDLTALDEEDLLSLQAALLQKMKQYKIAPVAYEEEPNAALREEDADTVATFLLSDATEVMHPSPSSEALAVASKAADEKSVLSEPPAGVLEFWSNSRKWPSAAICWTLHRSESGLGWGPRLRACELACARLDDSVGWIGGGFFSTSVETEGSVLFWEPGEGDGEIRLHLVTRALNGNFNSVALFFIMVNDIVLQLYGSQLFDGVASVPELMAAGPWEVFFLCPECPLPNPPFSQLPANVTTLMPYDTVEMAAALGYASFSCSRGHRPQLSAVAPHLTLELLASRRMTDEQVSSRLQIGNRVGAGGFSHIYLGRLRGIGADADNVLTVAVKQYIQRKPIFFSFDTPEERAAKELEVEQGAIVVFRRLHHEAQMLDLKRFITCREGPESIKDYQRLLSIESFSLSPPYLLTIYYEMGDLYRILHNSYAFPNLDEIWLIGVAVDIARGMRFLETCSPPMAHRDLKTPNVYVVSMDPNAGQRAVIGDLGTAVPMFEPLRTDTAPVTNPLWMANELIERKSYGLSADVYSFGIIMWELLTREHPFSHLEDDQAIDGKVELREAIVAGVRPLIPPGPCVFGSSYITLMQQCWQPDPESRPNFQTIVPALVQLKNDMVATKSNAIYSV